MNENIVRNRIEGNNPERWEALRSLAYKTSHEILSESVTQNQDWFTEDDEELNRLLEVRNNARTRPMACLTRASRIKLAEARNRLQQYTRKLKSQWWEEKARGLQLAADRNDMKKFYHNLREVFGPQKRGTAQLTSLDGLTIVKDKWQIVQRFSEHFKQLLNIQGETEQSALASAKQRTTVNCLHEIPAVTVFLNALKSPKDNRTPGQCGTPAEI